MNQQQQQENEIDSQERRAKEGLDREPEERGFGEAISDGMTDKIPSAKKMLADVDEETRLYVKANRVAFRELLKEMRRSTI